jgi:hypothetical protein
MINHGYALVLALFFGAAAATAWAYERAPRVAAVMTALGAAALAIGLTTWLDALATLTATGPGLAVLAITLAVTGFGFGLEAIRRHKFHRVRTYAISGIFGTAVVAAYASASRLLSGAGATAGQTGQALAQAVNQVQSGKAAAALPPSHAKSVFVIALVILAAIVVLAAALERRKKARGRTGGMPASLGAAAGRALPTGRRSGPPAALTGRRAR